MFEPSYSPGEVAMTTTPWPSRSSTSRPYQQHQKQQPDHSVVDNEPRVIIRDSPANLYFYSSTIVGGPCYGRAEPLGPDYYRHWSGHRDTYYPRWGSCMVLSSPHGATRERGISHSRRGLSTTTIKSAFECVGLGHGTCDGDDESSDT